MKTFRYINRRHTCDIGGENKVHKADSTITGIVCELVACLREASRCGSPEQKIVGNVGV